MARDFSPRVNFQCRLCHVCLYTPICNYMHNIYVLVKDPVVHVRVQWIMETLKLPACTAGWVAWLLLLAFPFSHLHFHECEGNLVWKNGLLTLGKVLGRFGNFRVDILCTNPIYSSGNQSPSHQTSFCPKGSYKLFNPKFTNFSQPFTTKVDRLLTYWTSPWAMAVHPLSHSLDVRVLSVYNLHIIIAKVWSYFVSYDS